MAQHSFAHPGVLTGLSLHRTGTPLRRTCPYRCETRSFPNMDGGLTADMTLKRKANKKQGYATKEKEAKLSFFSLSKLCYFSG